MGGNDQVRAVAVVSFVVSSQLPDDLACLLVSADQVIPLRPLGTVLLGPFEDLHAAASWAAEEGRMAILAEQGQWQAEMVYLSP